MSADHDRTFIRTFLLVLGALVAFTFVIIVIARTIISVTQPEEMLPKQRERVERRAAPVFAVVTDPAQVQRVAMKDGGGDKAPAQPKSGQEIYQSVCSACHQAGVAGAPKFGDAGAWQPRVDARGESGLVDHALNGFNAMPAKGGNPALSDEDVKRAVEYILEQAGV